MPKEIKEKHPLRLIRWANDGYPPIDLSNEFSATRELIMSYKGLEIKYENTVSQLARTGELLNSANEKNKQLVDALLAFITFDLSDISYTDPEDTQTLTRIINEGKNALQNNII